MAQLTGDDVYQQLMDSIEACNGLYFEADAFPHDQVNDIVLLIERLENEQCLSNDLVKEWLTIDPEHIDEPDSSFWKVGLALLVAKKRRLAAFSQDVIRWLDVDCDWYNEEAGYFVSDCNDKELAATILKGFPEINNDWGQLFLSGSIEEMSIYPELEPYFKEAIASAEDSYAAINLVSYLIQIGTETSIALAERSYFELKQIPDAELLRQLFLCHYVFEGKNSAKINKYQREVEVDHKKFQKLKSAVDSIDIRHQDLTMPPDFGYTLRETAVRTDPKIGRNEPCPCGSGKKYKKCCL